MTMKRTSAAFYRFSLLLFASLLLRAKLLRAKRGNLVRVVPSLRDCRPGAGAGSAALLAMTSGLLGLLFFNAMLALPATAQSLGEMHLKEADLDKAYQARRDTMIAYYAERTVPGDYTQGGYFDIAANLYRGERIDWAIARLDTLMQAPTGDMFWMYPFTTVMFVGRNLLPDSTKRKMRDLWRTYRPYRGDTENHWLLYYATLYLAAQMYPDEPGESWFTGKSSAENRREAEEYIDAWIELTTTRGQGEYDSPHYLKVYLAPMALLYAYAEDPAMRQRAAMMLDYLIADFATEHLDGFYAGGAYSRLYEREVAAPWWRPAARMAWLLFGTTPFGRYSGEGFILAVSGYAPPPILHHIARDRAAPYVHREYKRTRHRFRYSDVKNAPVYKYLYMRPEYALGSSQGGLLQPIQQQTWGLTWTSADSAQAARSVLFSLHPYSSPTELGMYFADLEEFLTEIVVRSKTEYDAPDKLTGGSPYEQVFQHEDVLIALYDIEPDVKFPHINAFFSNDLEGLTEDSTGWIFARGGDALVAYYPMASYRWEEKADYWDEDVRHQRLVSPHLKNGGVVQAAPASAYDSFEAFQADVRALPLEVTTEPVPSVRFTSLGGDVLVARYGETPTVNGEAVDYESWPLYDGPFLHAERGSKKLEIRYGPMRRLLDFTTLTITDGIETPALQASQHQPAVSPVAAQVEPDTTTADSATADSEKSNAGEAVLYASLIQSKGYVVGTELVASGLHRHGGDSAWVHVGWNNPRVNGIAYDPAHPDTMFVAAGNGALRTYDGGKSWRITTDWRVTEVQDVALDPHAPTDVYLATAYGVWRSQDQGETWQEANAGLPPEGRHYTETIEVDRTSEGRVLVGTTDGVYVSEDRAATWKRAGIAGVEVLDLQQSPTRPTCWIAATYQNGLFWSCNNGQYWTSGPDVLAERSIHGVAFDPFDADRMVAVGWNTGVQITEDGGATWTRRGETLPEDRFYEAIFDANVPGRIWVATLEAGVYFSDDLGRTWTSAGLDGTLVFDMLFVYPASSAGGR